MNKEFYEKFHQKGGSYLIPTEIFNELLDELEETIELQERIDKANFLLRKILVVRQNNIYRPVKNTTSQDVYKTIVLLNTILDTPDRMKYNEELERRIAELKGE